MKTLKQLKEELRLLTEWFHICRSKEVEAAINIVRKRNAPRVAELKAEIESLQAKRPKKNGRWPEDCPENVIKACASRWRGTTESQKYRIHAWTDKAAWTSYGAGGYSDNSGWHRTTSGHEVISLAEIQFGRPKTLRTMQGRQKPTEVIAWMKANCG